MPTLVSTASLGIHCEHCDQPIIVKQEVWNANGILVTRFEHPHLDGKPVYGFVS